MPIPFGEWAPDAYGVNADFAGEAAGVLPRAVSYGPWPQLAATSLAVPAAVRGAFAARTAGNAVAIYAFTAARGYKFAGVGSAWTNITRLSVGDYALAAGLDPVPVGPGVGVALQPATARQARISSGGRHRCSHGRLGFIGCCLVPAVLPLESGRRRKVRPVPSRLKEPTCARAASDPTSPSCGQPMPCPTWATASPWSRDRCWPPR